MRRDIKKRKATSNKSTCNMDDFRFLRQQMLLRDFDEDAMMQLEEVAVENMKKNQKNTFKIIIMLSHRVQMGGGLIAGHPGIRSNTAARTVGRPCGKMNKEHTL